MELAATAKADVPIAICVFEMPTTYINNGTARREPPPPIIPRVNPTTTPDSRERMTVTTLSVDTKIWSYTSVAYGTIRPKKDCIDWVRKKIIDKYRSCKLFQSSPFSYYHLLIVIVHLYPFSPLLLSSHTIPEMLHLFGPISNSFSCDKFKIGMYLVHIIH